MKNLLVALVCFTGLTAIADPTIMSVVLSQARPWDASVSVTFMVSGTEHSTWKLTFTAYDGGRKLGTLPETSLAGDFYVDTDGAKCVTFDPSDIDFLKREGAIANFRLGVSCEAVGNVLYKVIDLRYPKGTLWQTIYVTEDDLHCGQKIVGIPGSPNTVTWEMSSVTNHINGIDSIVWTGVTNNTRYIISHLVLRRVHGRSFTLGTGAFSRSASVGDCWMSVFPLTEAQVACLEESDPIAHDEWKVMSTMPCVSKTYGEIRGLNAVWPEDGGRVDGTSVLGLLRRRSGITSFDLPTEAQWEWVCCAGTTTTYYNNTDDGSTLTELAWYSENSGNTLHRPGRKLPNAWGFYDMIGNVWEFVRDWYSGTAAGLDSGWEPAGMLSAGRVFRLVRGGAYTSGADNCSNYSRTGDDKTAPAPSVRGSIYGFRVVQVGW